MSVNFFINSVAIPFVSVSFASYNQDPGLTNICSIVNYTSINVDINENMLKVACYMSFTFTSFINEVEPNIFDMQFCILDNQNFYDGCPKNKQITKFFSYSENLVDCWPTVD